AVERETLLRLRRGGRRGGTRQRQHEQRRKHAHPHACRHAWSTIVAIPVSRMITRKTRFPSIAPIAKKRRRPCGGGSSSPTLRVARNTVTAAASAAQTIAAASTSSPSSTVSCGMPQRALAGLHAAIETPVPARKAANHVTPPARKPNHWS